MRSASSRNLLKYILPVPGSRQASAGGEILKSSPPTLKISTVEPPSCSEKGTGHASGSCILGCLQASFKKSRIDGECFAPPTPHLGGRFKSGAFRRAAVQKQVTTSGAKHSPPASSTLVARRAENLGFSSLRDISHFTSRFDRLYVWRFYASDFVILVHHVLTSYVKLRMKIPIIYPCRK